MAGTIKIIISSLAMAILYVFAIAMHLSAAIDLPPSSRILIVKATQKANQQLSIIKAIHHIEEEAMLPLHSYTIKAGGYSFSIHTNGITIVATHTPTVWKAVTHRLYSHINMMLCMVCFIFLAVVYCYERFYYRQREAYPPCGHVSLLQELSHKKIKNIYSFSLLIRNSNRHLLCSITHYITSKQKHCEHTRSLPSSSIPTSLSLHKLEVLPWYV